MRAFMLVWVGQAISLLGTGMSNFALTIWAYEVSGKATALALVGFFFVTPMLLISPIAGALVDRSNRKMMMMVSDLGAGLATVVIFLLHSAGVLRVWHLYVAALIAGTTQTFQWPAYSAAITMMIPKEHYGRASGLTQLADSASGIFAPILAGALLGIIGLRGILLIDITTFLFAIGALLVIYVPQPERTAEDKAGEGNLWQESLFGFRYIFERPSLLGLQLVFLFGNLFATLGFTVIAPMILARTGNDEISLATVQSAGAIGGVVGALLMSAWGGPRKRVHGVLMGWMLAGIFGLGLMGAGRALPAWAAASFLEAFIVPILNGSNQAIWQAKVAPDVQGRVFSIRRVIAWLVNPLATLIAGPLADVVMEPSMQSGGWVYRLFHTLVGSGPGAGMSVMVLLSGLFVVCVGLAGYAFRVVRDVETLLPDHAVAAATGME
ncbi:MAG: MFS transporter [Anaerolineae bacterium]|nr:MAG: MFS transporter [Anaerolineae bacterium]